ncbi:MAG: septum formation inhibitor Maf [Lachnospiraceae bacterium]|nr:septum formation inhibitor Maf [Lachnospiraceae bacterium]MBQ1399329.1 septum formation inhibitor Maf [Lachnospiraceae bacterium]MBQ1415678.1 septum formation inhibitor Maf [Lachnospiraceae bacterium]MBQ1515684.1 septum formation inhibitor Maf [Lachnospiraceae bacterium]MBQ4309197.1 septum formation inhibitor Maf [Lachnospiraceae bacterium]
MKIILASASPRRRELLEKLKIPFEVKVSGCSEDMDTDDPAELVKELSRRKAAAVAESLRAPEEHVSGGEKTLILGADTIVVSEGTVLGKPVDEEDAFRMIRGYSGRTHEVLTGVTLIDAADGRTKTICARTAVTVAELEDDEIRAYVATGEPMDKAGAYGIQGLFEPYVDSIEGEYSNVVGLPLAALRKAIKEFEA